MTDELRWYLLSRRKVENLIVSAFRAFRRHGIEPILIKGWAAAQNYPEDRPRFYGDIDLAVAAHDFDRARELADDPESGILGVDVHLELRHLDTLSWSQLFSNSELVGLDGEMIRVLSAEDHLRVLCVHWLTDGGESRDRLWDIFYAVQNRGPGFDWDKCLGVVNETRQTWITATVGLAHKYLGLDLEGIPFAEEAKRLPAWLTRCVEREWTKGVRLRPLHTALNDRRALFQQIRKRIPPNPIQSTIFCEAGIDSKSRVLYQMRDTIGRFGPSVRRVGPAILGKDHGSKR